MSVLSLFMPREEWIGIRDAWKESEQYDRRTWLYFIAADTLGTPIKIGIASDPFKRLSSLQSGNFVRLELLAACQCLATEERAIHATFEPDRIRGEWFWPSAPLIEGIAWVQRLYREDLIEAFPRNFSAEEVAEHRHAVAEIMADAA